jgi:hypothetical protein
MAPPRIAGARKPALRPPHTHPRGAIEQVDLGVGLGGEDVGRVTGGEPAVAGDDADAAGGGVEGFLGCT